MEAEPVIQIDLRLMLVFPTLVVTPVGFEGQLWIANVVEDALRIRMHRVPFGIPLRRMSEITSLANICKMKQLKVRTKRKKEPGFLIKFSIHSDTTKMYKNSGLDYWWPGMKKDVARLEETKSSGMELLKSLEIRNHGFLNRSNRTPDVKVLPGRIKGRDPLEASIMGWLSSTNFSAYSSDISGELQRLACLPEDSNENDLNQEQKPESESFSTKIVEVISPEDLQPTIKIYVDSLASTSVAVKRSAAAKLRLLAKLRSPSSPPNTPPPPPSSPHHWSKFDFQV
ncbi:hypothetical protein OSB04_010870 [Centaurea solstitialis]|uniref:Uncharacterized protein n=1 Tax=Centaurea solstitialis TaxID=347529 RepID=A0AA38TJ39_9ASTR|nr:hypothetical protein OSB04_010870 [Centaurea solstitialis]